MKSKIANKSQITVVDGYLEKREKERVPPEAAFEQCERTKERIKL
jgi:hypothetical protein